MTASPLLTILTSLRQDAMPRQRWLSPFAMLLGLIISVDIARSAQGDEPSHGEELFVRRVLPLLNQSCWACHGQKPDEIQGELSLTSREAALRGGASGVPAIKPGDAYQSPLVLAVMRDQGEWSAMPPKESQALNGQQIDWLRKWISEGAPWPVADRQQEILRMKSDQWSAEDGILVTTSGGLSPEWTNRRYQPAGLWAYQPLVDNSHQLNHDQSQSSTQSSSQSAAKPSMVDAFIASKWSAEQPVAGPADARTFLRRATLDLTGLPPTSEESDAFAREYSADPDAAVARCVERLLASPRYGERMAQHWLDVVRYADSSGFANDYARGNAWRYRDYVVRSFNEDKPYDQFIIEQIAGDEMTADGSLASQPHLRDGESHAEGLIAVGYLRMGPWELTGMEVARVARQRFLDDVTGSVGETFLAQPLQCARCHDHKFDPIPTGDYYAVQAVFANTQLVDRPAEFLSCENTSGFEEARYLEMSRDELRATMEKLDAKSLAAAEPWLAEHNLDPSAWRSAVSQAGSAGPAKRRGVYGAARNIMLKDGVPDDQIPPRMLGWSPEEIGLERISNKGLERLTWEMDRYQPIALSVFNGPTPKVTSVNAPIRMPNMSAIKSAAEATHVLLGGDPFSPAAEVQPHAMSAIQSLAGLQAELPASISGRRLALAKWIADHRNPLTPRVIANRIWMWHFDIPLAGNPNNFGSTGKRPSHPELLDWLAIRLIDSQWSIKSLHRLIMNSQAYRRASQMPTTIKEGGHGELIEQYALFKPRRLTAEEIRDCMLSVSGELNKSIGGIPNRPEINSEAALQPRQVMGTFAAAWVPNPLPEQRHRRSLYALKLRGLVDPALELFNAPAADFSCERREVSTVTPQVFALLNSQNSQSRSLALAHHVLSMAQDESSCIKRCFQHALGRLPSDDELAGCLDHWRAMQARHERLALEKRPAATEVRRDAVEENTGERFSYTEKLFSNQEFVPDLQAADCDARTRGLAEVCLVLLNTNEFIYVY